MRDFDTYFPALGRLWGSLTAKFLLGLIPVFVIVAGIGFTILSEVDQKQDTELLAARVGAKAAKISNLLTRHHSMGHGRMTRDLISMFATDQAVLCVELRNPDGSVAARHPGRLGCSGVSAGYRLTIPVGDTKSSLLTVFNDAEIAAAAAERRSLQLAVLAVAFAISIISALIGFRLFVARPLGRLHGSIKHIVDTGERVPIDRVGRDEIGRVIGAFNQMVDREEQRESELEAANRNFADLNRTLEERVAARTQQLLDSSRNTEELIGNYASGIYIHRNFKPLYANDTLLEMLGFESLDAFLSIQSTEQLLAPEERERIWGYHQARLKGEEAPPDYDFWALKRNGDKLYVNNRSFVLNWEGEPAVCTTLYDLTERLETQKTLADQQFLLGSILENTHEGFWFIDLERRTTDVNPAMCKILGRPKEEVVGRTIFEFVDEENQRIFEEQVKLRDSGQTTAYEIELQRPDGSLVPCLNNATRLLTADGEHIGSVGIWADITEIKTTQRRLEAEMEKAQAASVAKSEFLAIASHELRTPLNGVLGMTNLLEASDMSGQQRDWVEIIGRSSRGLLSQLNDILDISKIESGRVEIEYRDFNIRELVQDVLSLMGARAAEQNLDLGADVASDVPNFVRGDPTRVRQVLINIVGNAVKFTAAGSISVSVSVDEPIGKMGSLRFEVVDTGPGIEPDARSRIFEKFTQADSSTTRKFGGTGLGLAICKDLVALLGGQIGVESEPGKGSMFWFTVNFENASTDAAAVADISAAADFAAPVLPALRLLVAEDNSVNQLVASEILTREGHTVDIVGNGIDAVNAIKSGDYDAVLMDVHMPEMDGLQATRAIRKLPGGKSETPIIALTSAAMTGDRKEIVDAGMSGYVAKPFELSDLLAALGDHFDAPNTREELVEPQLPNPSDAGVRGVDLSTVDEFIRDNESLWQRVKDMFRETSPECIEELEEAFANRDRAVIQRAAHTIKSSSLHVGATRLSELCRQLEALAESDDPAISPACLDAILDEFRVVMGDLEQADISTPQHAEAAT